MKINKKILAAAAATLIVLVASVLVFIFTRSTASENSESENVSIEEDNPDISDSTLLIYLCGSSLETTGGFATANIKEMLDATISDDVNIVIETGGTKKWRGFGIESEKIGRYSIRDGNLVKVGEADLAGMGKSSTLSDFIKWGTETYPAKKTSLILWNHGGGFVKGACYDELFSGDWLTVDEITSALSACGLKQKLAFIGFDACKMACFDTAVSISPFADYMIASQDLEHSGGWDYKVIAENLGREDFYEKVLGSYGEKHSTKGYYTLSCTDLSKIEKLRETLHKIISAISGTDGIENLSDALDSADIIESASNGYYDFGAISTFYGIETDFSDIVKTENSPSKRNASGLNLMFPSDENQLQSYLPVCQDGIYKSFLENYFAKDTAEKFCFENNGFSDNERLSFTIQNGSEKYIRRMEYVLGAIDIDNQVYYRMGVDNDFKNYGNTYSVNFTGKWVYFGGYALTCEIMTEKNGCTVFSSPVKINGSEANLIFTYNGLTRKVKLNGYVRTQDSTGRIMTLAENDEVSILYYKMDSDETAEYGKFTYDSNSKIEIKQLPDYYYVFQGVVTDIYGDVHYTKTAVAKITDGKMEIEGFFAQ